MGCLNCGKEIEQNPKKRAKQFCNSTCRSGYWQRQKSAEKRKNNLIPTILPGPTLTPVVNPEEKTSTKPTKREIKINEPKSGSMAYYLKYGEG